MPLFRRRQRLRHGDPEKGTGCGQLVPVFPPVPGHEGDPPRFYRHTPCDQDTREIRPEDFPPRPERP
jgi:hypothetical protein